MSVTSLSSYRFVFGVEADRYNSERELIDYIVRPGFKVLFGRFDVCVHNKLPPAAATARLQTQDSSVAHTFPPRFLGQANP